jgi:hypothetical protein
VDQINVNSLPGLTGVPRINGDLPCFFMMLMMVHLSKDIWLRICIERSINDFSQVVISCGFDFRFFSNLGANNIVLSSTLDRLETSCNNSPNHTLNRGK